MKTENAWIFGLQINLLGVFKQMTWTWLFWYFPVYIQEKKKVTQQFTSAKPKISTPKVFFKQYTAFAFC